MPSSTTSFRKAARFPRRQRSGPRLSPRRGRLRGGRARSRSVLGASGGRARVVAPWTRVLDWQPPHAKWFVGGQLNASVNCLDRHVRGARRNKAAIIWEGEPGDRRTLTYFDLHREVSTFANVLKSLGVEKGDRVAHLHAAGARAGHRDARLRPHRRRPQRGLRRLQRRVAARPHQRRAGAGCSSRPTAATAAATSWPLKAIADEARRRDAVDRTRRRASSAAATSRSRSTMKEGRDHWYHELMAGRVRALRARADGRRGHALHPLHLGHHREAQGHRPHDRRLSGRHLRDDQDGVRSARRRRVLVHGRHRLGDRAQLRRLRPARQRRDGGHVRGRARLAAEGPLLGAHRAVRRHGVLHGAHGHSRVHALGHRVARSATICRRCGCWARLASRSIPRRGCGTTR